MQQKQYENTKGIRYESLKGAFETLEVLKHQLWANVPFIEIKLGVQQQLEGGGETLVVEPILPAALFEYPLCPSAKASIIKMHVN